MTTGTRSVIKQLFQSGLSIDHKFKDGLSALMTFSRHGYFEEAKLLLKSGAAVDSKNDNGWSALMFASRHGQYEVAKLLLESGAHVDLRACNEWSSLMFASQNGHYEVSKLLLKSGASVDLRTTDKWSALMIASVSGHFEVARLLLENGACVDLQSKDAEWSALMIASMKGHTKVAAVLLENGALVDLQTKNGWSALMIASQNERCEVAKLLLDSGASVDMQTEDGWSALMSASHNGHYEVAQLLLENDAHVDLQNKNGWSALMSASQNGHCEVAKLLLQSGACVDLEDEKGWTALMSACTNVDCEMAKLLLKCGASVDLQNNDGFSSLMIASEKGHLRLVDLILKYSSGAEINLKAWNGIRCSCLHCAIVSGNLKLVRFLLARGAKPNMRDNSGHNFIAVAIDAGAQCEMLALLLQAMKTRAAIEGLQYALSCQSYTFVNFLFRHCLFEIAKKFPISSNPQYPELHFIHARCWSWITSESATVGSDTMGITISVPEGTLREEDSTDLLIHPCVSGPFEMPAGYEPASPAYLVQPSRAATIHKDVTVRMHHYADLQTEEDCEEMVFVFASSTPLDTQSGPVYRFKEVTGGRCVFRPRDPVGQITLRHFCFIRVCRHCRRRQGSNRVSPVSDNCYSARLYRNLSDDVFSTLSAVFCTCLSHPVYTDLCDIRIREYSAISKEREALTVYDGPMLSSEIKLMAIHSKEWEVTINGEKISKEMLHPSIIDRSDFPPTSTIYVCPRSGDCNSPSLKVTGLGEEGCCFHLVTPSQRSSSLASASITSSSDSFVHNRKCHRSADESEASSTKSSTLSLHDVLTEIVGVAKEWRDLGISLDLNYHILQEIEADHIKDGVRRCLEGVIHSWLEGNGSKVSWSVLCKALRSELVSRPNLAADIEHNYVLCID